MTLTLNQTRGTDPKTDLLTLNQVWFSVSV